MQRVFLHGGDDEAVVGGKGDAGMGALPFQIQRLARRRHPMQRHAIVARGGDAQTFRREGEAFDGARLREFARRAVGKPHEAGLAMGIGDRALRAAGDLRNPFARRFGQQRGGAIGGDAHHLAVFATGQERGRPRIADGGQQAGMGLHDLFAAIETVDRAAGGGKEGDVTEKGGGEHVARYVEGGDGRHQASASMTRLSQPRTLTPSISITRIPSPCS